MDWNLPDYDTFLNMTLKNPTQFHPTKSIFPLHDLKLDY